MNRRLLAGLALLAMLALGGCLGSTEIPEEDLTGNATYDLDTNATATFNLSRSSYTTVIEVQNMTELSVFERDALGTEAPVELQSLQFQYTNGTVVNATHTNLSATLSQRETVITLPAENGTVGYTARRSGKSFASPTFVNGSYELVLPPNARIGVPLLSQASPGGYATTVDNGRMSVRWEETDRGSINVRYYLQRDLFLFAGLVLIGVLVAVGGTLYYLRKIRKLESQRKELGIDVDQDDDPRDRGPPPGMG